MKKVRCAIYTRKSSEEGLEQDFNSLHALREACAAYILSQASEGCRFSMKSTETAGCQALHWSVLRSSDCLAISRLARLASWASTRSTG